MQPLRVYIDVALLTCPLTDEQEAKLLPALEEFLKDLEIYLITSKLSERRK